MKKSEVRHSRKTESINLVKLYHKKREWSTMKIDLERCIAEIDLKESSLYIVKDGKVTKIPAINHGEDKIIWKNGQVLDFIRSERVRI